MSWWVWLLLGFICFCVATLVVLVLLGYVFLWLVCRNYEGDGWLDD